MKLLLYFLYAGILAIASIPAYSAEIHDIARKGNVTQLTEFIEENPQQLNARDEFGNTPLILASSGGNKLTVQALLSAGADVNAKTKNRRTALYYAASQGHKDIVNFLLESRADVNVATPDGMTPLLAAANNSHDAVVELLLAKDADVDAVENSNQRTALQFAAARGNSLIVKSLARTQA